MTELSLGVGLDVGTMNLVVAKRTPKGLRTRRLRDAFLDLPESSIRMLKMGKVTYIPRPEKKDVLVIGDSAMEYASMFNREVRRPLKDGLVSASESDSLDVLGHLIKKVLGKPKVPGEICYFSVPAAPVDAEKDVIYHRRVFSQIIKECGFTPVPANEASAVIYSEASEDGFSGIGISFGSGMTNVSLVFQALEAMTFSMACGGDWIDEGAAKNTPKMSQARVTVIKEQGVNLLAPEGRVQKALTHYYRELIEYTLHHIAEQFVEKCQMDIQKPVPIIISGGTSKAGGFLELFNEVFEQYAKEFPIKISEIRMASDPLNSVALGMLLQALQENQPDEEEDGSEGGFDDGFGDDF